MEERVDVVRAAYAAGQLTPLEESELLCDGFLLLVYGKARSREELLEIEEKVGTAILMAVAGGDAGE